MGRISFMEPLYGNAKISSHYAKRDDPMNPGTIKKHNGIDYVVDTGNKVRASASGEVIRIANQDDFGKLIIIDHAPLAKKGERKIFTLYAHLSEVKPELKEFVLKGEVIGKSGDSGTNTTGSHLHFGVFDSKYATDVLTWSADEGPTGVEGHNASNPENYIGHGFELDGAILDINDLIDKTNERVGRVMEVVPSAKRRGRDIHWRTDIIVDGKKWGYMDKGKTKLELNLRPDEAIAFLRKPMKEHETDENIVYV